MLKASSTILFLVSLLFSINVLADEDPAFDADAPLSSVFARYLDTWRSDSEHDSPALLHEPMLTTAFSDSESQPIANLDFRNSAAIARVGRLRELSLLTLAEGKGARLFFGVDKRGLVGLHLKALARGGDERCLEVARMPYLEKSEPHGSDD